MSSINQVIITARVAMPVVPRISNSGTYVCDIALVNNRFDKNGTDHRTFVRATAWAKNAEWAMDNLSVGDLILAQGKLCDDNFVKDDGQKTKGRLKIDDVKIMMLTKAK